MIVNANCVLAQALSKDSEQKRLDVLVHPRQNTPRCVVSFCKGTDITFAKLFVARISSTRTWFTGYQPVSLFIGDIWYPRCCIV